MHVRVELTGGRASGKSHLAARIAQLLLSEALPGQTWEVVTRLAPGQKETTEASGGTPTPPINTLLPEIFHVPQP